MLQLNTIWKLPKITLIKSCEQMWVKTFYFATLIFVKLLKDKGDLYEFSGIYENVLVPLFKSLKPAGDLFAIILNVAGGFSGKISFFSLLRRRRFLAPCLRRGPAALPPHATCSPAWLRTRPRLPGTFK